MANANDKRTPTGIFGLDQIVSGGFREKTAVVVVGASGTGKSTFANSLNEKSGHNKKSLFKMRILMTVYL